MLKFFVAFKTLAIRFFKGSVTISEEELRILRPKTHDGRKIEKIADTAVVLRRFQPHHFDDNGDLNPAYFEFPKKKDKPKSGQSFLLRCIASPWHALHPYCNDGKHLPAGAWEVYRLSVAVIPRTIADPEARVFYFKMIHAPYATCRAHCELFCSDNPSGSEYVIPGSVVKTTMRIKLSRLFISTGVKVIVSGPKAEPLSDSIQ